MKRLGEKISPVLMLALIGLWLLLNQTLALSQVVVGVILAVVLASATSTLRPVQARLRRLDVVAWLVLVVFMDIVRSNVNVILIVLGLTAERGSRSGFLRIPIELRDPHGLAGLAMIVTATPGTVWAGLSPDGDALMLHVLRLKDDAGLIRQIKDRYERPLMQIFE